MQKKYLVAMLVFFVSGLTVTAVFFARKLQSPSLPFLPIETRLPTTFIPGAYEIENFFDNAEQRMWLYAIVKDKPAPRNGIYYLPLTIGGGETFEAVLGKVDDKIGLSEEEDLNPVSTPRAWILKNVSEIIPLLSPNKEIAVQIYVGVDRAKSVEQLKKLPQCDYKCFSAFDEDIKGVEANRKFYTALNSKGKADGMTIGPVVEMMFKK